MRTVRYQERFSETHAAEMFDAEARRLKAAKVIAILEDHLGDLGKLHLLDLGCSNGLMTRLYGGRFKDVVGVDIDEPGIAYAIANNMAPNIRYSQTVEHRATRCLGRRGHLHARIRACA